MNLQKLQKRTFLGTVDFTSIDLEDAIGKLKQFEDLYKSKYDWIRLETNVYGGSSDDADGFDQHIVGITLETDEEFEVRMKKVEKEKANTLKNNKKKIEKLAKQLGVKVNIVE